MSVTRVGLVVIAIALAIGGMFAVFRAIDQRSAPPIVIEDAAAIFPIVVEVRGAVAMPGVYEVPAGARMHDVVGAAGGLNPTADRSTVNLARRVRDGEVVLIAEVPSNAGSPVPAADAADRSGPGSTSERTNINTATVDELVELPGIGEVTAARIVEFRTVNGPYRSVDDLVLVQGISTATIDSLRDLVATAS